MTHNPTVQLLLACARPHPDPPILNRINRLFQHPIDWEHLVNTAQRNRVLPLVYRSLQQVSPDQVPGPVMQRIREGYLAIAARSLLLSTELLDVLKLFKDSDILAVPLKGPVLAESLYGDLTLRSFDDLDILVHPCDAFRARNLLLLRGYKSNIELTEDQFGTYLKTEYSMELTLNGRVIIDFHWDATGRYLSRPFGMQLFEDRLEKATLDGKEVYQPPVEYLLFYQCLHGSKNCWTYLESVCTLAEIIRSRSDIDWRVVQRLSREMRCEVMLHLGLGLAYALLDAAPPAAVLERARASPRTLSLTAEICKNLFCEDKGTAKRPSCSDFSFFHMKVRDRVSERIRYGVSLVFRPSRQEWRLFRLPGAFVFLYYPLRVMRLLWGFGIAMVRNHQKDIHGY